MEHSDRNKGERLTCIDMHVMLDPEKHVKCKTQPETLF